MTKQDLLKELNGWVGRWWADLGGQMGKELDEILTRYEQSHDTGKAGEVIPPLHHLAPSLTTPAPVEDKAGEGLHKLLKSRENELKLLRMAYDAMSREGWEKGPTIEEVRDSISAHLSNKENGVDHLETITPAPVESGLREELGKEIRIVCDKLNAEILSNKSREDCFEIEWRAYRDMFINTRQIISRHPATESIAELADRKGCAVRPVKDHKWIISIRKNHGRINTIVADTYQEAEAEAREYLNGLKDKENAK